MTRKKINKMHLESQSLPKSDKKHYKISRILAQKIHLLPFTMNEKCHTIKARYSRQIAVKDLSAFSCFVHLL